MVWPCVETGFGAGPGLGGDKGLLMSRHSFSRDRTFLSQQKTLCRNRNSNGGVMIECFSVTTHRTSLCTRQGAGRARSA